MNYKKVLLIAGGIALVLAVLIAVGIVFGGGIGDCDKDDRREGDIDCIFYWERPSKEKPKPTTKPAVTVKPKPGSTGR